ncbi:Hypothetical predicted protein [Octopus vulgaris]|uniref:Uncharacterized protein n=1 Tax=Octopus vulgaris TaxID=6645 RepID=A0AA36BH03_OCTVU|nr:Hypothetical predicted protein [Octopus vulgaris]
MTEQKEVKILMEEYKWYDVGETRYAVIEKKNIGDFMVMCECENWEVKDIRMSDEFVENMDEYFGVRMDMEFIRIGKEHSSDYEKQRTGGYEDEEDNYNGHVEDRKDSSDCDDDDDSGCDDDGGVITLQEGDGVEGSDDF